MYSGPDASWPLGQHISLRNLCGLRLSASQLSFCFSASPRATGIGGAMRRVGSTQSRGDRRGSAEDNLRQQHECIQVRMLLGREANIFLCAISAVSASLRVNYHFASRRARGRQGLAARCAGFKARGAAEIAEAAQRQHGGLFNCQKTFSNFILRAFCFNKTWVKSVKK